MIVYADASGLLKRYLAEQGSADAIRWLSTADDLACCRIGYVEVRRGIAMGHLPNPQVALAAFEHDWAAIHVVEVDDDLARDAAVLASMLGLRSLDALHLAAAETVVGPDVRVMTWDRRFWRAAHGRGLAMLPPTEP